MKIKSQQLYKFKFQLLEERDFDVFMFDFFVNNHNTKLQYLWTTYLVYLKSPLDMSRKVKKESL